MQLEAQRNLSAIIACVKMVTTIFLLALLLFSGCIPDSATGAGGTDFPNTRTASGKIYHTDGSVVSFTDVFLLSENFVPSATLSAQSPQPVTTDSSGVFIAHIPDTGHLVLTAVHQHQRTRALVTGIFAGAADGDTVHLESVTLKIPGVVSVRLPDNAAGKTGQLFFKGTNLTVSVSGQNRIVTIDSVPLGGMPELCFLEEDSDRTCADSQGDYCCRGGTYRGYIWDRYYCCTAKHH